MMPADVQNTIINDHRKHNLSCVSNSINTHVCLVFCLLSVVNFLNLSTEPLVRPGWRQVVVQCKVEYNLLCVTNHLKNKNKEQIQTPNCQHNFCNSCSRSILVIKRLLTNTEHLSFSANLQISKYYKPNNIKMAANRTKK